MNIRQKIAVIGSHVRNYQAANYFVHRVQGVLFTAQKTKFRAVYEDE
jgi:hypothetical protein